MANYDVQLTFQGISLLPKDVYVNVLHYDIDGDGFEGICDEIFSKFDESPFPQGVATGGHTIKVYPAGPNPTGPVFAKTYTFSQSRPSSGPPQVALALSYATTDDWDASTPRRRGRIYLGPLAGTSQPRPNSTAIGAALTLGEGLAQVGFASGVTWMMKSTVDNSYHKIEVVSVDDVFDTQRRRAAIPTARTNRDVQ